MLWLRLAWREIQKHRKFAIFFVLNLSLGITGFVALDAYRGAMEDLLAAQSREILGADLVLRALRPLAESERSSVARVVGANVQEAQRIDLYSMVASATASRLVELRAIDRHFPLYGEIVLEEAGVANASRRAALNQEAKVWIDTELRSQLHVDVGDFVQIGEARFQVQDMVQKDSGRSGMGVALAPRIYLGLAQLEKTKLIRKGSRIAYQSYFQISPSALEIEAVAKKLRKEIADPGVKIQTHRSSSRELVRALTAVSDFLGLVSLAALFLAAIGAAYSFRAYLMSRLREIAILMSLGVSVANARRIYVWQLFLLGLAAGGVALALSALLLPLTPSFLSGLLTSELQAGLASQLRVGVRSAAVALGIASGSGLLLALPVLLRLRSFSPAALFRENAQPALGLSLKSVTAFLPALIFFGVLAVVQARSFVLGMKFLALLVAACLGLTLLFGVFEYGTRFFAKTKSLILRLALREIVRRKAASFAGFVSLALCTLLIGLIPQLRVLIETDLRQPPGVTLPSLFLFDIQEEQVSDLERYLVQFHARPMGLSPLIRARLLAVDGEPLASRTEESELETREEEDRRWTRERSYNLTIREQLRPSERMVAGRPFQGRYVVGQAALPEISVEEGFAKRMGMTLGSVMLFDVQGVEVAGKIVSLRKVRWSSFEPNFFVQFQAGVLEDAPKTYLSAVSAPTSDVKTVLQNGLVAQFPNVSIVDVSRILEKILQIFDKMQRVMQLLAVLTTGVGFLLLILLVHYESLAMRWELNLLKVLGASYAKVYALTLIRFAWIALAATTSGMALSCGIAALLAHSVFELAWSMSWGLTLSVIGAGTSLSLVVAYLASRKVVRERALRVLVAPVSTVAE